jgi:hypothetical protein
MAKFLGKVEIVGGRTFELTGDAFCAQVMHFNTSRDHSQPESINDKNSPFDGQCFARLGLLRWAPVLDHIVHDFCEDQKYFYKKEQFQDYMV